MDFTIASLINDREIAQKCLANSLRQQKNVTYEEFLTENSNNELSVVQFINRTVNLASGNIFIWSHQDVSFYDERFLQQLKDKIFDGEFKGRNIIVGPLGALLHGVKASPHTNRVAGTGFLQDFRPLDGMVNASAPVEVETLDECFFACRIETLRRFPLPEIEGVGFDFYAATYCSILKKRGFNVLVISLKLNHVTSLKIFPDLINGIPEAALFRNYSKYVFKRMTEFYRLSQRVEEYWKKNELSDQRIPSPTLRYPLFDPKLRVYRFVLSIAGKIIPIRWLLRKYIEKRGRIDLRKTPVKVAVEFFNVQGERFEI